MIQSNRITGKFRVSRHPGGIRIQLPSLVRRAPTPALVNFGVTLNRRSQTLPRRGIGGWPLHTSCFPVHHHYHRIGVRTYFVLELAGIRRQFDKTRRKRALPQSLGGAAIARYPVSPTEL
jgi:hypothetical protein